MRWWIASFVGGSRNPRCPRSSHRVRPRPGPPEQRRLVDTIRPIDPAHVRLADTLIGQGVQYAFAGYIDVNGRAKSKAVPIAHLPELLAGHERYTPRGLGGLGAMNAAEDECIAVPDAESLVVLPWDRRVAWMSADLWFGGREPFALCPRSILKRQIDAATQAGYEFLVGVECEVY